MTLRRLSPKRQSRVPDEREFRERLMERANWTCEWCMEEPASEQHEVARGSHRQKARTCLFASLASGEKCHRVLHRMAGDDAIMVGLAIIQIRRPADYSLDDYWRLTGRNWPDQRDVDRWAKRLSLKVSV